MQHNLVNLSGLPCTMCVFCIKNRVDEFSLHSCMMMHVEHLPPLMQDILEISLTAVGSDFCGGVN